MLAWRYLDLFCSRPEKEPVAFEKVERTKRLVTDRHLGYRDCIFEFEINRGRCSVVIGKALDLQWRIVRELGGLIRSLIEVVREKS